MMSDDVFHSSDTLKSKHEAMDISGRVSRQVFILLILCWVFQHTHEHSDEYCDTEVFRAECSEDEVILLERARYGRMKLGRCVELDMGHIGCFTDVLRLADRRCSGRRMCELRVPDAEFESTQPCLKELKTYLEASYICVKIESVSADHCRSSEEINITSQSGYIASMSKSGDLCDAVNHPWVIAGQPGQKINLTIYDFASPSPSSPDEVEFGGQLPTYRDLRGPHTHPCRSYGTIYDSGLSGHSAICGTDSRVSNIYLSTGNSVKIFITEDLASDDVKRFLIKYSIVGCASPIVSEHAWFVKESDTRGAMGCLHTDVKWDIECLDGEWTSGSINCTLPVTEEAGHDVTVESLPKYYFDLIDRQHQSHHRPEKVSQDGGQFGGDRMDDVHLPDDQDRREYFEFAGLLATTVTASFIIIILVVLIVRVSKRRKNEREVSGVNSPETILLQNNSVPEVVEINYRIDDSISRIESSFKAQNNEQWRLLVNGKENKTFQTTAVTKKCLV